MANNELNNISSIKDKFQAEQSNINEKKDKFDEMITEETITLYEFNSLDKDILLDTYKAIPQTFLQTERSITYTAQQQNK